MLTIILLSRLLSSVRRVSIRARAAGLRRGVSNGPNDAVGTSHALSLAVLASVVEVMNPRDCVLTSARPWAFLYVSRTSVHVRVVGEADILPVPIQLAQFYQGQFLVTET